MATTKVSTKNTKQELVSAYNQLAKELKAAGVTAKSGRLTATAEVVTRGREIVTAEAKLLDKNDRLFAAATSTLMILRNPTL